MCGYVVRYILYSLVLRWRYECAYIEQLDAIVFTFMLQGVLAGTCLVFISCTGLSTTFSTFSKSSKQNALAAENSSKVCFLPSRREREV